MTRLLVVSNGHGEDFIAARLGEALLARMPGLEIEAFPLVGLGAQLERAGLRVAGPRRRLPADGFTMHDPRLLWRDLRAGLVRLTLLQAAYLRRARPDAVLVVGDVYAQLHASLVPAPRRVLQPLVSVHHLSGAGEPSSPLRFFMERYRRPELFLLRRADKVYTRDAATADYLRRRGLAGAAFLGNPMMDGLEAEPLPGVQVSTVVSPMVSPVVALLPGSREQAGESVRIMIGALAQLDRVHGLVAWIHAWLPEAPAGWEEERLEPSHEAAGVVAAWRNGERRLWWVRGRFPAVLAASDAVLGTAGTANEQAVGLGLPVVAFPVPPLFGHDYLRNQARLLGDGLLVAQPRPEAVARRLQEALHDEEVRRRARAAGAERMGSAGASAALADDLVLWLEALRPGASG